MNQVKFIFCLILLTTFGCQYPTTSDEQTKINTDGADTLVKETTSQLQPDSIFKTDKLNDNGSILETEKIVGDLEIVDSKFTYNDNFEPILEAKIKNNHSKTIIAFEIEINSGIGCDIQTIRKKSILAPGKTITIRQKFKSGEMCSPAKGKVYIGDYIFSDGSKRDPGDLYLIRRSNSSN